MDIAFEYFLFINDGQRGNFLFLHKLDCFGKRRFFVDGFGVDES